MIWVNSIQIFLSEESPVSRKTTGNYLHICAVWQSAAEEKTKGFPQILEENLRDMPLLRGLSIGVVFPLIGMSFAQMTWHLKSHLNSHLKSQLTSVICHWQKCASKLVQFCYLTPEGENVNLSSSFSQQSQFWEEMEISTKQSKDYMVAQTFRYSGTPPPLGCSGNSWRI